MNILSITAGAAGMYCGSCIRDNALAAELKARGHRILLVPMYTPTLTDETNVSEEKVLFGGISVYLQQHSGIFRKLPRWVDRLWDSTAALKLAARGSLAVNPKLLGELTVSMLEGERGFQKKEIGKMLEWLRGEPPFDVVTLPNSLLISLAAPIREALGRPVCCTLQGEDLFLNGLQEPYRSRSLELMRAAVGGVDGFAAVSAFHAQSMRQLLAIPAGKMHVLPLGINLAGFDTSPRPPREPFTIGYFARVAPEKGLDVLCEAYRTMRNKLGLPVARLEAAGYLAAEHRPYLEKIEQEMRECGLGGEFHYRGSLDREGKLAYLRGLDVLSVPATYDEPKGLSLLEAMASGIPVAQPRRGSFTEMVESTGGGVLTRPDDPRDLAEAIVALWKDPDRRRELGRRGAQGVRERYSAARMAERAVEVYGGIARLAQERAPAPC
jgi:glycosyltransferase involved in cell wall biosynthesis